MKNILKLSIIFVICFSLVFTVGCNSSDAGSNSKNGSKIPYVVQVDGKYGLIDSKGKTILKPQFGEISNEFSEGYTSFYELNTRKQGYIDTTGKIVVQPVYEIVGIFSEGLAHVCAIENGERKYGYIDKTGKMVIKPQFDYAFSFKNGLACVGKKISKGVEEARYGFIDKTGKVVVDIIYDDNMPNLYAETTQGNKPRFLSVYKFYDGACPVKLNGKWGLIDTKGKYIVKPLYFHMNHFYEGLALVVPEQENKEYWYVDTKGKIAFKMKMPYKWLNEEGIFSEGLASFYGEKGIGFVDKTGKVVIQLNRDYYYPSVFSEGFAAVKVNDGSIKGRYTYVDKKGKILFPSKYDYAGRFFDGMACVGVMEGGMLKTGYVNTKGEEAIKPQFGQPMRAEFKDGIAQVVIMDSNAGFKTAYIDKKGKYIWKPAK